MSQPNRFVVTARSDGRGGFRPFGTYSAKQAGAMVSIGSKSYKVGRDGRVNIPKAMMESMGILGADGRRRVTIEFASSKGIDGWKKLGAVVGKPPEHLKDATTGDILGRKLVMQDILEPYDSGDYSWSP